MPYSLLCCVYPSSTQSAALPQRLCGDLKNRAHGSVDGGRVLAWRAQGLRLHLQCLVNWLQWGHTCNSALKRHRKEKRKSWSRSPHCLCPFACCSASELVIFAVVLCCHDGCAGISLAVVPEVGQLNHRLYLFSVLSHSICTTLHSCQKCIRVLFSPCLSHCCIAARDTMTKATLTKESI